MKFLVVTASIFLALLVCAGAFFLGPQMINSNAGAVGSKTLVGTVISAVIAGGLSGGRTSSSSSAPVREITWERALDSAKTSAYLGNKIIVVDVYTDWCGWCKKMDQTIYSNQDVAALSRDVVFLKLNAEDHGEGQRFARENGVTGYPTTFLLDSSGRPLKKQIGYISSTSEFIQMIQSVRSTHS